MEVQFASVGYFKTLGGQEEWTLTSQGELASSDCWLSSELGTTTDDVQIQSGAQLSGIPRLLQSAAMDCSSLIMTPEKKRTMTPFDVASVIPSSPCIPLAVEDRRPSPFGGKKFSHWSRTTTSSKGDIRRALTAPHLAEPPSKDSVSEAKEEAPILPCFDSAKDAIKRISPDVLTRVLDGEFTPSYKKLLIVDCRYPYEFHGGHLPGAVNVCNMDLIDQMLFQDAEALEEAAETVVVFHCEFSSERAPRMALHVRNLDRVLNAHRYPALHYPQLYILDGGYKNFYLQHPSRCDPPHQYVPMRNSNNRDELKFHQRLKFQTSQSHGKHRHKLRSCSLRKSLSLGEYTVTSSVPYTRPLTTKSTPQPSLLSSDIGDICDQAEAILQAAESLLS